MQTVIDALQAQDRIEWRKWLEEHYQSRESIWLIYYKKHTGKRSVSYDEAVEEALCFGWIDGQIKSIDDERYMQRFTPRRSSSNWSVTNIGRVKKMIAEGKMTDWGKKVYEDGIKKNRIIPSAKNFTVPIDLQKALKANKKAWTNFQSLSPSARLAFAYWVDTSKTAETRRNRIEKAIQLCSQGKKLN